MKKLPLNRNLTIAAGILVAMLIIFTLWTSNQKEEFSGSKINWHINTPAIAKNLFQTTFSVAPHLK